jgi:hypothetical protein
MKKLLLVPAIALLLSSNVFAQSFSDVTKGHPYYTALSYLKINGIITGYSDSSFQPYNEINRAELLKLLMEGQDSTVTEPTEECFNDVALNQWYTKYVCTAKNLGFIEGYKDGSFQPGKKINKVEAIKMLSSIYQWTTSLEDSSTLYYDTPESAWYAEQLKYAKSKNYLEETGNLFNPSENITRASISSILYKHLVTQELDQETFNEESEKQIQEKYDIQIDEALTQITPNNITLELSWQNPDVDLDLHLIHEEEEIYFFNKYSEDYSTYLIQGTLSESINIEKLEEGTYSIFAKLYEGEISFSHSGAQLQIYQNNVLLKTISPFADEDYEKDLWQLIEISKLGDIKTINTLSTSI